MKIVSNCFLTLAKAASTLASSQDKGLLTSFLNEAKKFSEKTKPVRGRRFDVEQIVRHSEEYNYLLELAACREDDLGLPSSASSFR